MIREVIDASFCNKLESDSSKSRSMWSTVNDTLSCKPYNELETSYYIDGQTTNDEFQIATGFKQYFATAMQESSQVNCFFFCNI